MNSARVGDGAAGRKGRLDTHGGAEDSDDALLNEEEERLLDRLMSSTGVAAGGMSAGGDGRERERDQQQIIRAPRPEVRSRLKGDEPGARAKAQYAPDETPRHLLSLQRDLKPQQSEMPYAELSWENSQLQQERSMLQQENETLQAEIRRITSQSQQLAYTNRQLEEQKKELEAAAEQSSELMMTHAKTVKEMNKKIAALQRENERLGNSHHSFDTQLLLQADEHAKKLHEVEQQRVFAMATVDELTHKLETEQKRVQAAALNNERLRRQVSSALLSKSEALVALDQRQHPTNILDANGNSLNTSANDAAVRYSLAEAAVWRKIAPDAVPEVRDSVVPSVTGFDEDFERLFPSTSASLKNLNPFSPVVKTVEELVGAPATTGEGVGIGFDESAYRKRLKACLAAIRDREETIQTLTQKFEDERLMANELRKEVRILAKRELSDHSLDNEPLKALSRVLHATLAPVSVSASPSAELIDNEAGLERNERALAIIKSAVEEWTGWELQPAAN